MLTLYHVPMNEQTPENRLGEALSPYLLQHADNPVAWQPWDAEALAMARTLDRPILLSIGYSACHWCHVMAHECFENDATAERMNAHYVNIKVDREERPDLDRIYQLAHQLLTGRGGGWPLTAFLDPETQAPFFAGTYFPNEARHGLVAFPDLLERIHGVWATRRDELRSQHLQVTQALKAISQPHPAQAAEDWDGLAEAAVGQLAAAFDAEHGGFGQSHKFPQVPQLGLLLDRTDDDHALQMLGDTLAAMARFGLQDHLAGGFFRYCVDRAWEIPHFEKMLSDNALLLGLYADAWARWQRPGHRRLCEHLVAWLDTEMSLAGGGFAASLDADSSDGEGAYYVWSREQVNRALAGHDRELVESRFGLDGPPNFEGDRWHLLIARDLDELATPELDRDAVRTRLDDAAQRLLAVRRERPAPGRDDKLIAGWNGLAIEALARAGRRLDRPDWRQRAAGHLDAVAVRLFGEEPPRGIWRDGRSAQLANLDDHATMLLACLELLQWRFESRWFNLARRLARRIDRQFVDDETGATFLTPLEHEPLVTRPLAFSDDATPAGAGLGAMGLLRLGHLCGDPSLIKLSELILQAAAGDCERSPLAHATLIRAGLEAESPTPQVLMAGPDETTRAWQAGIETRANLHVYRLSPDIDLEEPPELLERVRLSSGPVAHVCSGLHCLEPATSSDALRARLSELAQ
jgi:uncharacterized protein YyaL (SSP411 family)